MIEMTEREFNKLGHTNYYKSMNAVNEQAVRRAKMLNMIPFVSVSVPESVYEYEPFKKNTIQIGDIRHKQYDHLQHGDVSYVDIN